MNKSEEVEYDNMGVEVKYNKETEGWDALEPYCVECGKPESEVEVNYFTIENEVFVCCDCNEKKEEQNVVTNYYQRKFTTKAKTIKTTQKALIKHIKTLLNIKSSNRVYNIDIDPHWDSDRLYFDKIGRAHV